MIAGVYPVTKNSNRVHCGCYYFSNNNSNKKIVTNSNKKIVTKIIIQKFC